ncbi:ribonuclease HII [Rubrivirga sp. SAORIC476]|uniref:ribonuclease HII n=1 Tax=Rubrivirga sp. SAORIC476 TaxID=1961794 RepID=UPI000BA9158B|nr:ribonuclease HII [Rubrivirga sp. SAORIC476]PAP81111.1 ribonuclease HII [Rubrivirga sp. SAORIC476]
MPDLSFERRHWDAGRRMVVGLDEAGRGCLAGPVVAAAVVLPPDAHLPGLDDSKKLSAEAREALLPVIQREALAVGIGQCSPAEVDELNVLWAAMEAMRRAAASLPLAPDLFLVDGNREVPGAPCPQETVIKGDTLSLSIAAASVVAKVTRDRIMVTLDAAFPVYGWAGHKGYPTAAHYAALAAYGPSPHHRRSFRLTR